MGRIICWDYGLEEGKRMTEAKEATKEVGAKAPARKVSKKELEARISGLCQSRGWNLGKIREKRERVKV